jgi:hypothetical protein
MDAVPATAAHSCVCMCHAPSPVMPVSTRSALDSSGAAPHPTGWLSGKPSKHSNSGRHWQQLIPSRTSHLNFPCLRASLMLPRSQNSCTSLTSQVKAAPLPASWAAWPSSSRGLGGCGWAPQLRLLSCMDLPDPLQERSVMPVLVLTGSTA